MTKPSSTTRVGWWRLLLAALAAALVALLGATSASAATAPNLETRVGASTHAAAYTVGAHECVSAGQRWGHAPRQADSVVATGVAAKTGTEVVKYDAGFASRNLLSQVGEGYAVTPGGRTVSAHAADRIVNGAPGRSPTSLERIDDILNNPTQLRYRPDNDTVRVYQGKDWAAISGTGLQHVVTVMVR